MEATLDMAKVTSKGQITIPKSIRTLLGLQAGDRVLFVEAPDGSVSIRNATMKAFDDARAAFAGAAKEAGLTTDDDVMALISEMRRGQVDA